MILYYLDASVWVKRYYVEAGTSAVADLFSAEEARDSSIQSLKRDWARFVQVQVSDEILDRAGRLAREFALRSADAIHLASALSAAESLAGSEHHLILATCDRELSRATEASGLELFDPEGAAEPA